MIRNVFVVSICVLVLAGCNQGSDNYASAPRSVSAPAPAPAPMSGSDERVVSAAGVPQQAQQLMAYSHAMWLVMDADAVQSHFEHARDRCLQEAALNCILLSGSANAGDKNAAQAPAAELVVTLPHDQVAAFEKSLLGAGVIVRQQSVQAENITQQAVDIDRRMAQLTSYRDRLTAIAERPGVKADDLIQLEEKISELQGQLDELAAQKTTVGERAHRERVTISFTAEATVAESQRPIARALDQSFEVLGESASAVILLVVAVLPWVPVGLAIWGIVWFIRRNKRRRKEAQAEIVAPPARHPMVSPGRPRLYDWDAFHREAARILCKEGRPKTKKDFARRMETWFIDQGIKQPDLRQIERRISDLLAHLDGGNAPTAEA